MGKERESTPLEPITTIEVIDASKIVPVVINIDETLRQKQTLATARGLAMVNKSQEKITIKKEVQQKDESLNESNLIAILTKEEYQFYQEKKELYMGSYPDLGSDPFDLDDLHLMIMEQIFQRNLLKKKKKHPTVDIAKDYQDSVKRQNDFKKSLSMRRTDRVKTKTANKPTMNIANLSLIFQDPSRVVEVQQRMKAMQEEEAKLIEGKTEQ